MVSKLHAQRYSERAAQMKKHHDFQTTFPSSGIHTYIEIPDTPVPLCIDIYHNVKLAKNCGCSPVQVTVKGLSHPDIADEDFLNYFGLESKDNRLLPIVNLVEQLFENWYNSKTTHKATIPKKGMIQSILSLGWREEAGLEFRDYFKRYSIKNMSIDSFGGSVNRMSSGTFEPTDEAISALEPSELIMSIKNAVPEIQRSVREALKISLPANATETYMRGFSNALSGLNGSPHIDMRLTEALVNDAIGRPMPQGVTKEYI